MDKKQIQEIKNRLQDAKPDPNKKWIKMGKSVAEEMGKDKYPSIIINCNAKRYMSTERASQALAHARAHFIVHAPEDIKYLLGVIGELEKDLKVEIVYLGN